MGPWIDLIGVVYLAHHPRAQVPRCRMIVTDKTKHRAKAFVEDPGWNSPLAHADDDLLFEVSEFSLHLKERNHIQKRLGGYRNFGNIAFVCKAADPAEEIFGDSFKVVVGANNLHIATTQAFF